jgi:DNA-binding HxlR family transcriptional regulator
VSPAFQARLGIASNVLTNTLKLLCDEQVLERVPDPERLGRPKYVLPTRDASSHSLYSS